MKYEGECMKRKMYTILALGLLSVTGCLTAREDALTVYNPHRAALDQDLDEGMTDAGLSPVSVRRGERGIYPGLHRRSEEPITPSTEEPLLMYPGDLGIYPGLRSQEEGFKGEEHERRGRHRRAHGKEWAQKQRQKWAQRWAQRKHHDKAWGKYKGGEHPARGPRTAKWQGHPWYREQQSQED